MTTIQKPKMIRIMNSLSIDRVRIEKGSFQMGSNESDREKPIHKVTLDYAFEMGKYPVTIAEYRHFAKEHPEHKPEWEEENPLSYYQDKNLTDNAPIIGVSWHNAVAYCEWLSKKTGRNYRLPSEAEWEYACRAGSTSKWYFGNDEKELDKYAWYNDNSKGTTHLVGEKLPNKWGLYDMHGNVWEWCLDDYVNNYKDTPIDGSANHSQKERGKILRGGSWVYSASWSRSALRFWSSPVIRSLDWGFRLLRTLP